MPELRFQVLAPGKRFVGRDRHGAKRFVEFTPEYCREQCQRNNAMIQAGIPVPVCWEHRDDATPGRFSLDDLNSEKVRERITGHVLRYELGQGDRVFGVVNIPDERSAKQAEVVRFCSPEIDYFTDGHGKEWGEVFTHIALTPRPREHDQPPATRLSVLSGGRIRLAVDPKEGTDMHDENEKRAAEDAQDADQEKPDDAEKDTPTEFGALVEALQGAGFNIPAEVKDLPGLIIAIKASDDGDGDGLDDPDDPNAVAEVSRPNPISMSHGKGGKGDRSARPADDDGDEDDSTHPALAKQQEQAASFARRGLHERVNALVKSGRITPVMGERLRKDAGKVRLSFTADGDLEPNAVVAKVEAYEALPKSHSFTRRSRRARMGHGREVDAPAHVTADDDGPDESPAAREARQKAFQQTVRKV